jgi:Tol biopolymer transport system component
MDCWSSQRTGGGREHHITRGNDYGPAWGPGGKRIVFTRFHYGNGTESRADLRIYRRGSSRLLIRDASNPSWSVHNWIAFDRSNATTLDRSGGIWAIRPDGSGLHRILDHGWGADWSPDGRRLVFTDGRFIKTVRADGTGLRRLRRGYAPAYSPDGHKIVYLGISARLIKIMGSDGTRPHRVPHPDNHTLDGEESFSDPAWQPLPPPLGR